MTSAEVPESVALDRAAGNLVGQIQRHVAKLRAFVDQWEPRPCPDNFVPPRRYIIGSWDQ